MPHTAKLSAIPVNQGHADFAARVHFNAMACGCEIVASLPTHAASKSAVDAAIAEVRRIESKFSRYRDDSIVSIINAAAGKAAVACDDETWELLELADRFYCDSDGLFDITAGVLRRAWDFKQACLPEPVHLATLLACVGWPRVERHAQFVRLQAGMEMDFGGFGKEYAVDRAAMLLESLGVDHGYVNLGGDVRVIGPKPDGQPWTFGIRDPRNPGALVATIPLSRGGLATSGDYERYFELDGVRYCHILDARSGWPVNHSRSVSVIAATAVMAGQVSTIAMLKQAQGLEYLKSTGLRYFSIDQHGTISFSPKASGGEAL